MMHETTVKTPQTLPRGERRKHPVMDLQPFALPSSFWQADYIRDEAAAHQLPFVFWSAEALRPSSVVTLGTGAGAATTHFALCQTIGRLALPCRSYCAIGQEGGEQVLRARDWRRQVHEWNEAHYSAFSRILSSGPEDVAQLIGTGSVDLLNIHGESIPEGLQQAWPSLEPLLSTRAVVLVHGIDDPDSAGQVARFYSSLSVSRPSFEFTHGLGLGVISWGDERAVLMDYLVESGADHVYCAAVRNMFWRLGQGCVSAHRLEAAKEKVRWLHDRNAQLKESLSEYEVLVEELGGAVTEARKQLVEVKRNIIALTSR